MLTELSFLVQEEWRSCCMLLNVCVQGVLHALLEDAQLEPVLPERDWILVGRVNADMMDCPADNVMIKGEGAKGMYSLWITNQKPATK